MTDNKINHLNTEKVPIATCSRCGRQHQWDWCQDTFWIVAGEQSRYCTSSTVTVFVHKEETEITAHICICGKVNATTIHDKDGAHTLHSTAWKDIDWEAEENSHDC